VELSELKFPIPVSELEAWVPHRLPMIWVSDVLSVSEKGGECRVVYDSGAHYASSAGLRRSSLIEWIAQAYAFTEACRRKMQGTPEGAPAAAYLVGLKQMDFFDELYPEPGDECRVTVKTLRAFYPLILFEGNVFNSQNQTLARGVIKVYAT